VVFSPPAKAEFDETRGKPVLMTADPAFLKVKRNDEAFVDGILILSKGFRLLLKKKAGLILPMLETVITDSADAHSNRMRAASATIELQH
jgi:hypothetical protein